jgi:Holliday junction DNA helicase RuvB
MSERIVSQDSDENERAQELALRPKRLQEFVGQHRVRKQLSLLLDAAIARGAPADHILLSGMHRFVLPQARQLPTLVIWLRFSPR